MQKKFEEYAKLLVEVGVNIQKGQNLVISCPVDCAWFARMCAKAAYAAGCREVVMSWGDELLTREKYLHAADDVFDSVPEWRVRFSTDYAKEGAAFLHIGGSDPEILKGVEQDRLVRSSRSSGAALKEYRQLQMSNAFPWAIGAIPVPSWAKKVFPDCPEEEAMAKLWDAILTSVRVTGDGKAVERWKEHLDTLQIRIDKLNALRLESLHYTNSLGTDLTIRLPEDHIWGGGDGTSRAGIHFIANMPTEEIFTAPLKNGIDGVVYASMPLVLSGDLVKDFHFVIREGRIVEVHAQVGEEKLKAETTLDEGASYFGEVALVPYDSPIRNQELLFYNTLFDENAACHLAFGEAYSECIKGGENMTKEELKAHGLNDSITHGEFMVGTADLNITGRTHSGEEIPIFINGNFAL